MRTRYQINNRTAAYFTTSPIVEWLPVFTSSACCDIVIQSLEFCRRHKGLQIFGWVILPHHFHAVLAAPDLSATLADLKKFTARQILDQVAAERREWLINQFTYFRAAHKTSARQVWQEGFHPREILSDEMMVQKLEYTHNNPVRAGYVASPEHWRYSSAHEGLAGAQPILRCDLWK